MLERWKKKKLAKKLTKKNLAAGPLKHFVNSCSRLNKFYGSQSFLNISARPVSTEIEITK